MKQHCIFFFSFLLLSVFGCEGPVGPAGPQGPQGAPGVDGVNILGSVFEVEADFNPDENFMRFFSFPTDEIEVFDSDVVLVYILWEVVEDSNGDPLDLWRLLPQTVFTQEGAFQYNFDYTALDVRFFMEGEIDMSTLGNDYTQDQIFRIVVLPADFASANGRYDYSDYEAVIRRSQLDDTNVKRYILN
jgi:hypothetical protein